MKIHVHLGAHKTATTFIQSQLFDNRELLSRSGIGIAGIAAVRRQFTGHFDRLSWIDPVSRPVTRPYLGRQLEGLLDRGKQASTFILSDENLAGLISMNYWSGGLYRRAGARTKLLDQLLASHDTRFFLSIRRYPDYLTSSWLQLATRGRAPSFEKYLRAFPPASRGWSEIVEDIARACGPGRLTVWTYDWFRADPARVLSLLAPGVPFSVPEQELRRDVLPSLTMKGLRIITALDRHLSPGERKRMGQLLRNFPFEEPNPRLEIADPALLAAYETKYRADLDRIRALGVELHDAEQAVSIADN